MDSKQYLETLSTGQIIWELKDMRNLIVKITRSNERLERQKRKAEDMAERYFNEFHNRRAEELQEAIKMNEYVIEFNRSLIQEWQAEVNRRNAEK